MSHHNDILIMIDWYFMRDSNDCPFDAESTEKA